MTHVHFCFISCSYTLANEGGASNRYLLRVVRLLCSFDLLEKYRAIPLLFIFGNGAHHVRALVPTVTQKLLGLACYFILTGSSHQSTKWRNFLGPSSSSRFLSSNKTQTSGHVRYYVVYILYPRASISRREFREVVSVTFRVMMHITSFSCLKTKWLVLM